LSCPQPRPLFGLPHWPYTGPHLVVPGGSVAKAVLALVMVGLLQGTALGQVLIKPKMLVVFDTSGSMTWTPSPGRACQWTCPLPREGDCVRPDTGCPPTIACGPDERCRPYTYGDGSISYPGVDIDGNGRADDSRLYIAKEALATLLAGTAELEFGLMRYAQAEGPFIRSTCTCAACGPAQCLVSPYDVYPYGAGEGAINYDGTARGCRDGGELLVPVGEQQGGPVLSWLDHREDFPWNPQGNRELRADGPTPIAGALDAARRYFADQVVPADPRRACRDYYVLLLTDGEETCVTDAAGRPDQRALEAAARALLDLRVGGQPAPVRTFVIGFGADTAGSPYLNAIAAAGGTQRARFAADRVALQLALAEVVAAAIPREQCNARDDDCDGVLDENLLRPCVSACGEGTEVCVGGAWQGCSAQDPAAERCNLRDDDCDGRIDEGEGGARLAEACDTACGAGVRACFDGVAGPCTAPVPEVEVCNGVDEDCDGRVDEGVTRLCQTACGVGRETCQAGQFGACDAPGAAPEACNGRDDDCDGRVDEALTRPCGNACGQGQEVCLRGVWLGCDAPQVGAEACNGRDDDCDGRVDEQVVQDCSNACSGGVEVCRNGRFADCSARLPHPEVCDAVDDDCDGRVDEGLSQPCQTACGVGQQRCADGRFGACSAPDPQAEVCNGADEDCDGAVDENATTPCESACGPGVRRCVAGVPGACNAPSPRDELCNDRDDDCDGQTDEGLRRPCRSRCGEGIEICRAGAWVACDAPAPRAEACNGADEDCDGRVDEAVTRACDNACGPGTERCMEGAFEGCDAPAPRDEACNGRDDDCDGRTDENLRRPCETVCGTGLARCVGGDWACDAPQPAAETCDLTDEDCDGVVDEEASRACFTRCGRGTEACSNGTYGACTAPKPAVEVCNGRDDDCDEQVDEDQTRVCQGTCGAGLIECVDGALTLCSGVIPAAEACNGVDDDCDGVVDESSTCEGAAQCRFGGCAPPCVGGECSGEQLCIDGFCTRDPCRGVGCDGGRVCFLGDCVEPACRGHRCPEGEICSTGICVPRDCFVDGCAAGAVCRNGQCQPDACLGVVCDARAACQDGACVGVCAGVLCPAGALCIAGICQVDPCTGVVCPEGKVCELGACLEPCTDVVCPEGRLCHDGRCVADPCLVTQCPAGLVCREGGCGEPVPDAGVVPPDQGVDAGRPDAAVADATADAAPASPGGGDSGCACDVGGSGAGVSGLWLLLLACRCRRRRRILSISLLAGIGLIGCDGGSDAPQADAAPACGVELCNQADDDCDGLVDEDFDLVSSPLHCGACGIRCNYPGGEAVCEAGVCRLAACQAGFVDADGRTDTGCEATCAAGAGAERCNRLDDDCDGRTDEDFDVSRNVEHCGACGHACVFLNGDARCEAGQCALARCQPGFSDADARPETGCEAPCAPVSPGPEVCDGEDNDCDGLVDDGFAFLEDGENCGRCGIRCAYAHGAGMCVDGLCQLVACEAGFVDADGRPQNGCEARCEATGDDVCNERDDDCDGQVDEGFNKQSDVDNCGGCGQLDDAYLCRLPNADPQCLDGACLIGRCRPGFSDADGRVANGCETVCTPAADGIERCNQVDDDCDGAVDEGFDFSSLAHCGACNRACGGAGIEATCEGGNCVIVRCPPGFVDADQDPGTGCEYACAPAQPGPEVCNGADDDCDRGIDEGFDLLNDTDHCGGCGAVCQPPHGLPVCQLGQCDLAGCEAGWFDADDNPETGCEADCSPAPDGLERCDGLDNDCDGRADEDFDFTRDALHCGRCDLRCAVPHARNACIAGRCQANGCLEGWYDLDGMAANGCEYRCDFEGMETCDGQDDDCDGRLDEGFDTRHDAQNCGGCGIECAADHAQTACRDGLCAVIACDAGFRDVNGRPGDGCEAACVLAPDGQERCNGVDDDCDGRTDEAWDFANDADNCGGCGRVCGLAHGDAYCNAGRCALLRCAPGFADADGQAGNGCECVITNGGRETCDGTDEDCNGVIDDADQLVPPPAATCLSRGVCQGVRPACRAAAWICPYSADFEAVETRCDGLDNDCNGRIDEPFPTLGRPCAVGVGVCGEAGTIACQGPAAASCSARLHPERQGPEVCNELDDDCDGRVDEGADHLVAVPAGGGVPAFSIYAFEASRADATAVDAGQRLSRACSSAGVVPWTSVDQVTAEAACEAAGLALCTPAQWGRACAGAAQSDYPYGVNYQPAACNGEDFDADPNRAGNQDFALVTGALAGCVRQWGGQPVFDLSGNVWEWTADVGAASPVVRGGSFGNLPEGLTCGFELAVPAETARETVGFRCCTP